MVDAHLSFNHVEALSVAAFQRTDDQRPPALEIRIMDGYPSGSLDHNVPFLVASGLNSAEPDLDLPGELSTQGQLVKSDLPPLESREAQALEKYFEEIDKRGTSWSAVSRDEPYRLRIKTVGRVKRNDPTGRTRGIILTRNVVIPSPTSENATPRFHRVSGS